MINPLTGVLGGTAIFGVITACWGNIKLYASKFYSLFVVRATFEYELATAIKVVLWRKFKFSRLGLKNFHAHSIYVRPARRTLLVGFEKLPEERTLFRRGWRFMSVTSNNNKNKDSTGEMEISFIRGTFKLDDFIQYCIDEFNNAAVREKSDNDCRFYVRREHGSIGMDSGRDDGGAEEAVCIDARLQDKRPLRWSIDDLGEPKPPNPMEAMVLSDEARDALLEAQRWSRSGTWFKNHFVPWKRGWLLHGPPGTGKTSFVRAMAQELDMPIISFDLATMTNRDFERAWDRSISRSPCIILLEDIDAVFERRKNIAVKDKNVSGLTFDCLLNTIDGVENADGIFLIVTTNHLEKLDPALAVVDEDGMTSRPGRVDRIIEFRDLTRTGRIKMINRILGDLPNEYWEDVVDKTEDMTGAQVQEYCARRAMQAFWDDGIELDVLEDPVDATNSNTVEKVPRPIGRNRDG